MRFTKIAATGALALALSAGSLAAQDYTLKFAIPTPAAEDSVNAWIHGFEKLVEQKTQGRIDVQLFFGGQLGSIPTTIEGVAMGTVEAAFTLIGFLSSVDPRYQVLDASGLFQDEAHANRAFRDPEVRAMFAEFGQRSRTQLLAAFTNGQTALVSRQPIAGTGSFDGLKIRTGGATPLVNRPLEALGASPVSLSIGEVLPALQTGTIDAAVANTQVFVNFKYGDVADEAVYLPGNFLVVGAIISQDFLDRIGPELAEALQDAAAEALPRYDGMNAEDRAKFEGLWAEAGGTLRQFDPEERARYLEVTRAATEEVLDQNPQLRADYGVLADAARRTAE